MAGHCLALRHPCQMRTKQSRGTSQSLYFQRVCGGRACKPDSVPRTNCKAACARGDHSSSPGIATGIQQPTRGFSIDDGLRHREWSAFIFMNANSSSRAGSPLLFGLAPRGVFRAPGVTTGAVGSYPTFSPLPNDASISKTSHRFPCAMPPRSAPPAVYSLWHFP
jgi:hypothetical protein